MNKPLVSICCLTYNHESYIRQCLEGFMMQKTNFSYEVLIHDDASTDKTADIIREYEIKYPAIIKAIYQKENQYSKKIGISETFQYPRVKGKYIALCEGDDYWIDPYKLQKQVDILEKDDSIGLVYGKSQVYIQKKNKKLKKTIGEYSSGFEDLLENNKIPTQTVLVRSCLVFKYVDDISPYAKNWLMGDYPLWLYIASYSKLYFLDNILSVYRLLHQSASARNSYDRRIAFIESSYDIARFFIHREKKGNLKKINQDNMISLFKCSYIFGRRHMALKYGKQISMRNLMLYILYLICYVPILFRVICFFIVKMSK